ncbi:MAG: MmcQ/YjbR family DNA-binding protein [Armatimonas sp.]
MTTVEEVHTCCEALPSAEQTFPFGETVAVYKVGGKMFALVPMEAKQPNFSVKCDPEEAILLREQYSAVTPGYHLNKRHWNTVTVDGSIPEEELEGFIKSSWKLVAASLPRKIRQELELSDSDIDSI